MQHCGAQSSSPVSIVCATYTRSHDLQSACVHACLDACFHCVGWRLSAVLHCLAAEGVLHAEVVWHEF